LAYKECHKQFFLPPQTDGNLVTFDSRNVGIQFCFCFAFKDVAEAEMDLYKNMTLNKLEIFVTQTNGNGFMQKRKPIKCSSK
jgi:hypothetical protein